MTIRLTKILLLTLIVITFSCNDNPDHNSVLTDNFDREEMLSFWADDIIVPAYTAYNISLEDLYGETTNFYDDASLDNLDKLRTAWLNAYMVWQRVSIFEIGKAEEIGLRNFTNIYPANVDLIHSNIEYGNYNLKLPSTFAAQGFPAIEYLLYGLENEDVAVVAALNRNDVKAYLINLVERLNELTASVVDDWNQGFREDFITNNGSSANASTDKTVNDFLFYYEKFLRAGKVGMPAGVFTGNEESDLVEGKYSKIYSKQLFEQGFTAARDFFGGLSFDGMSQGISLEQYLNEVHESNGQAINIGSLVTTQWKNVDLVLENVDDSFETQILEDNVKMLALYDELQKAIVYLKVDMLQALNIQVDFVDADGD